MTRTAVVYLKDDNGKALFGEVQGPEDIKEEGGYTVFPDRDGKIHRVPTMNIRRIEIKPA